MKKTLVTLAALTMASVVSAADITLSDATHYDATKTASISSNFSASDGDYTAVLILDWDKISTSTLSTSAENRTKIIETSAIVSGWTTPGWRSSMTLWTNGTTVYLGIYQEDGYATFTTYDDKLGDKYNINLTEAAYGNVYGNLALAYTFNSGEATVYALKSDGTTLASATTVFKNGDNKQWNPDRAFNSLTIGGDSVVKDFYIFDSALSAPNVATVVAAAAVPEPATATLSLLALAGLAARRRRK